MLRQKCKTSRGVQNDEMQGCLLWFYAMSEHRIKTFHNGRSTARRLTSTLGTPCCFVHTPSSCVFHNLSSYVLLSSHPVKNAAQQVM